MPMSIANTEFFQKLFAEFITNLATHCQKCYTIIMTAAAQCAAAANAADFYPCSAPNSAFRIPERTVLKMKSYLSSVLKSVLTVLIAVLIPVLMLAGCEKAPEEQQTIEDFLTSDEAAQQVEFIASIVCSQTADGFNGIVGSGTLWDFVFSDIESIRSLGTVSTDLSTEER